LKQPIYKQIFEECLTAVKKYLALMKTGKRFEKQLLEGLTFASKRKLLMVAENIEKRC
jgi:hypothetical protein